MNRVVTIAHRFRGPPFSGNGGYACGLLGSALGGCVEVTLKKPPPLDRPLTIQGSSLLDGAEVLAEARQVALQLEPPSAPSYEQALESATHYTGHARHIYPECFVCGPARAPADGLRIFAGRVRAEEPVAAPWLPDASLPNDAGELHPALIWAALDCPGYFALGEDITAVLGRMTALVVRAVHVGERCVVVGWKLGSERRKRFAGTALFDEAGALIARSQQVWIQL